MHYGAFIYYLIVVMWGGAVVHECLSLVEKNILIILKNDYNRGESKIDYVTYEQSLSFKSFLMYSPM